MLIWALNQYKYMTISLIFFFLTSELSMILAEAGCFSLFGVIVSFLITLLFYYRKINVLPPELIAVRLWIVPVLCLAAFLFFQPYQYMDGGWDPGNYINTGIHIARTGNILYAGEAVKDQINAEGTNKGDILYPGMYIRDHATGTAVPQFFYMFPVWVAIFYKLFGLKAAFYINPFFALINVFLIYLICKKLFGEPGGILSALLVTINIIQIWDARFPVSEMMGQFFILSGFWFWYLYLESDHASYAFWAGVGLGEFLLVNVTSIAIIPCVLLYLLYRMKKKDLYFAAPFLFLSAHLVIQLHYFSSPYFQFVLRFFNRNEAYMALLAAVWVISFIALIKLFPEEKIRWEKISRVCVAAGTPLVLIYAYFIRPKISGSVEALNLVELGHWLSVTGIVCAAAGFVLIIWKERREWLIIFSITALICAVIFIFDKRMMSRYPFALRRYIPIVIPAFCVCITYLFCVLREKQNIIKRAMAFIILPAIVIQPLWNCKDIVTVKDHHGYLQFWADLIGNTNKDAIYVTNSYKWAKPLNDIFGLRTIAFDGVSLDAGEKLCEFAKERLNGGAEIFFITDAKEFPYSDIVKFEKISEKEYSGKYLEHSLTFPPKIRQQNLTFALYKIGEIGDKDDAVEYKIDVGENNVGLIRGFDMARNFDGLKTPARWTFQSAELIIPWFGDTVNNVINVRCQGMIKEAGSTVISLYIDNRPVAENIRVSEKMDEYSFCVNAGSIATKNSNRVTLTIKSSTWNPKDYGISGFPEDLGVLLDWVKINNL